MDVKKVQWIKIILFLVVMTFIHLTAVSQNQLTVAKDGSGAHLTIQAAIDAVPVGLKEPFRIIIKKGKYKEKISIPSNKPFIHLLGESVGEVLITNDDFSGKLRPDGTTFGTSNSATVTVNATDFYAANITFENTTGESPQAVAMNANNDRIVFFNCRFLGGQDTLLTNGTSGPRQYYKNCYIDGTVDFIFGGARAIFDNCTIYCRDRSNSDNSYLTAANTQSTVPFGYVFLNCTIPANRGNTNYFLGRPWQNDGLSTTPSHSKTVFLNTKMSNTILPAGWSVWSTGTVTDIITYAEYKTKNLNGSDKDLSQRVSWSKQLTDDEAKVYTLPNIFKDWDPCSVASEICSEVWQPSIAIANYKIVKGTSEIPSKISWNTCWPIAGITYEILRAGSKEGPYSAIGSLTEVSDTSVVFDTQDTIPSPTKIFYYIIKGTKDGLKEYFSDTLSVSSIPTITLGSTELKDFQQSVGSPSSVKLTTIKAENLLNNLTISIPDNFEISLDEGKTWIGKELILTPVNKSIAITNTLIRLNAKAIGSYSGEILFTAESADTVVVKVSGITEEAVIRESNILLYFPYTENDKDSTSVRGIGIVPTVASFSNLSVSNGLSNGGATALPPFSTTNGMAVGAGLEGLGSWGTAAGGPGGTLRRNFYIEYQIVTDGTRKVRVDSLVLNASFYLTSSSTRLAVAYSTSNFQNDSTEIVGGIGPNGLPLPSNGIGTFANPISLPQDNNANNTNYRIYLAENGIQLNDQDTLTVRLYFSCSSSSLGRYVKIRNLHFKGDIINPFEGTLLHFPFSENDKDLPSARDIGVKEGLLQFNNLSLYNGMNNANTGMIPPFSLERGMIFGAGLEGTGLWSAASGGPGGTLRRHIYAQFTIQPQEGKKLMVDSLILNTSFYFTASGTRLGVVYSKDGFMTDSTDIKVGGIGPDGLPLPSNGFGSFTNGAVVPQENAATTTNYRLPFNGGEGVEILPDQTLTVRLYYSCSSGTAGRYAKIKDLSFKGSSSDGTTTSVYKDVFLKNYFSLIQNPIKDNLVVLHKDLANRPSFKIFDILGKVVQSTNGSNSERTEIDTQSLRNGNYFLQCNSGLVREVIQFIKY
jgi:pectin methylesterase-like acyl-CoA thioesterase